MKGGCRSGWLYRRTLPERYALRRLCKRRRVDGIGVAPSAGTGIVSGVEGMRPFVSFADAKTLVMTDVEARFLTSVVPVLVRSKASMGVRFLGTAFCLAGFANGHALYVTARHVVDAFVHDIEDAEPMILLPRALTDEAATRDMQGARIDQVAMADTYSDVALVRVDTTTTAVPMTSPLMPLQLALKEARIGETTMAIGYSRQEIDGPNYSRDLRASRGLIEEIHNHRRDSVVSTFPSFRTDGAYFSGMSGGPVIAERGGVVGVVSHGVVGCDDGEDGVGYAASIAGLLELQLDLVTDSGEGRSFTVPELFAASGLQVTHEDGVTLKREADGVRLSWQIETS